MNIPEAFIFNRLHTDEYIEAKSLRLKPEDLEPDKRYRMHLMDRSEEGYFGAALVAELTGKVAVAQFCFVQFKPVRVNRYPWEDIPSHVIIDEQGMILRNRYRERGYFLPPQPSDIEFSDQIADL